MRPQLNGGWAALDMSRPGAYAGGSYYWPMVRKRSVKHD